MARWGILAKLVLLMAISLTHTTVAVGTDAGNGEIRKAQWNEQHALALGTLRLVGRTTAGAGAAEEISVGSGLSLSSLTLSLAASPTITGDLTIADRIVHDGDTNTAIRFPAADTFTVETSGSERVRINSAGNVGIGTAIPVGRFNVTGGTLGTTAGDEVNVSTFTVPEGGFNLNLSAKAIRHTTGSGYLNTEFRISSDVDGNATKNAWLSFYSDAPALADNIIRFGEAASTEWMRIDNGLVGIGTTAPVTPLDVNGAVISRGVVYRNQPAQTSKSAAATLTIAELLTGIIEYTGAADTLTLPTGTLIEGGVPATFPTNMSFDFSVINTGSGTVTIGTAASLTLTGTMTVAAGSSGQLRVRKTATNTYTVYRIS